MTQDRPAVLVIAPDQLTVATLAKLAALAGCRSSVIVIAECVFAEMPHDVSDPKWTAAVLAWCANVSDAADGKLAAVVLWPTKAEKVGWSPAPLLLDGAPTEIDIVGSLADFLDLRVPLVVYAEKPDEFLALAQSSTAAAMPWLTVLSWDDVPGLTERLKSLLASA